MKKFLVVLVIVALLGGGAWFWISRTPEYAMKQMISDVKEQGIDGLYPHLTEDAQETVNRVAAISENQLLSSIIGLFTDTDYVSVLKAEMQTVAWEVQEIEKSKKSATVIVGFDYLQKLVGTMELKLLRLDGEWKIDSLSFPDFEKVSL